MEPTVAARALTAATEITTAALTGDDPDDVLSTVVAKAAELAEADVALVMVRADDGSVTVEAIHGGHPDLIGTQLHPDSVAAQVARGGQPVVAADVTTDPRTAPFVLEGLGDYGPFAATPFGARQPNGLLGALTVYRKHGKPEFSDASAMVLNAFASQAGLVLALADAANTRHRLTWFEERERIARELHDVIVQRLYAAGMLVERVRKRMTSRFARADAAKLADVIDELDSTIGDIRTTVRGLRSNDDVLERPKGTEVDLAESARGEVNVAGELLGFPPTLELSGELAGIPSERADHARAVLREALSNAVRHSGASMVRVELHRDRQGLRLRVRDNGCGVPRDVAQRGLRHIAERAERAGGKVTVTSSPTMGTMVAFDLPL